MVHEMMTDYQVSAKTIALISAYYYFLYTPLQLPAGILLDKYGPRLLLLLSSVLCTLGCLAMGTGSSVAYGKFSQLLIGGGSAFAFVGAMKLATLWLPMRHFAFFSGIVTMLGTLGALGADTILVDLQNQFNWRELWLLLGVVGLLITLMIFVIIKEHPSAKHPKSLQHATTAHSYRDFFRTFKFLCQSPTFWLNGFVGGALFLPLTLIGTLWGVPYLIDAFGFTKADATLATSMIFLGTAVGGPIAGWISGKLDNRIGLVRISAALISLFTLILISTDSLSLTACCLLIFATGFMIGPQVLIFPIASRLVDRAYAATAVAATNCVVMLWGIFVQPEIGATLDRNWEGFTASGHAVYSFYDYQLALSIIPISSFLALICTFFIGRNR